MDRSRSKPTTRTGRARLMSSTVLPVVLGVGVAAASTGVAICFVRSVRANPTVASGTPDGLLPEALPREAVRLVACNPCAAKNPCNPCAAANPCNPCAATNPCNPCNPCAAAGPCSPCAAGAAAGATECTVPRLQTAAANPCNPCAATSPCNPCAAKSPCSPCNPCAAANPCNPCAAANPCNPCAAANPCNPCAAGGPCSPCAAGEPVELTDAEAATVYDCVIEYQKAAYAASDNPLAQDFWDWSVFSRIPYVSATHGNRYVMNYSNEPSYGDFEAAGEMPAGAKMAKSSFVVGPSGQVSVGPLFLMEKMDDFDADTDDWRYTMIMPDGSTFGVTGGQNSSGVEFCNACHAIVAEAQDGLYFLPEEYRVSDD